MENIINNNEVITMTDKTYTDSVGNVINLTPIDDDWNYDTGKPEPITEVMLTMKDDNFFFDATAARAVAQYLLSIADELERNEAVE